MNIVNNRIVFESISDIAQLDSSSVILPCGFGGEHCPVRHCFILEGLEFVNSKKKVNLQTQTLYERTLLGISLIYRRTLQSQRNILHPLSTIGIQSADTLPTIYLSIHSSKHHNNTLSFVTGKTDDKITDWIMNFLLKYEFLIMTDWEVSYTEKANQQKKSRTYLMGHEYYVRRPVKYQLTNPRLIAFTREQRLKQLNHDEKSVISFNHHITSDKTISSFSFPTYDEVENTAKMMVYEGAKDKYGRTYVMEMPEDAYHESNGTQVTKKNKKGQSITYTIKGLLKDNCKYVDITMHLKQYELFLQDGMYLKPHRTYGDFQDRYYYGLAMLPKWIRGMILIDGEPTVEVDATALHNRLVGMMYARMTGYTIPDFLIGDSHTKLATMMRVSRNDAKLVGLSYWNSNMMCIPDHEATLASKQNKELFGAMDRYLNEHYHTLFMWLIGVKCHMPSIKNKSQHSNLSAMLTHNEVMMMDTFIQQELSGESLIYCYDCVYVKSSIASTISEKFAIFVDEWCSQPKGMI